MTFRGQTKEVDSQVVNKVGDSYIGDLVVTVVEVSY